MRRRKNHNPIPRQRHCTFCVNSVEAIDYKNLPIIKRFMSSYGKIVPRRRSGVCAKHQRTLATAIKRARIMALVPFTTHGK